MSDRVLIDLLANHGISRRKFLTYCAGLASILALPPRFAPRIARALEQVDRPSLIWLKIQDCTGCTESMLRSRDPTVSELILDLVSLDYHETIMAAAGTQVETAKASTVAEGGYLLVVEGSVPLAEDGVFAVIAGRTGIDHLREAASKAAAVIDVGTCASFGGVAAASPNPTGAVGVPDVVAGVPVVNLSGCPLNADNLAATLVHFLTFGELPATDGLGRPLFAYGSRVHDYCQRRAHFDAGQFALEWGDEGHRKGWCLYRLGCKGPATFANCPAIRWNAGTSWPVGAGHPCVGCSEPGFWDTMTPFYGRLPRVAGFGVETTADEIGIGLLAGTGALIAAHGIARAVQRRRPVPATRPAGPEIQEEE